MVAQTTNIPFPNDVLAQLEPRAKQFGMDVPTYLLFLARVETRGHDREFVRAAKFAFSKFPETLRKLSQ
ncbi:MAG: hypothetical protein KF678_14070 [Phycisphaeraceae bacterium]|nr:hypothetical protein [Phycisphaeraceae bacterium]